MKKNGFEFVEACDVPDYEVNTGDMRLVKAALKKWEADGDRNHGYQPKGFFTATKAKQVTIRENEQSS